MGKKEGGKAVDLDIPESVLTRGEVVNAGKAVFWVCGLFVSFFSFCSLTPGSTSGSEPATLANQHRAAAGWELTADLGEHSKFSLGYWSFQRVCNDQDNDSYHGLEVGRFSDLF